MFPNIFIGNIPRQKGDYFRSISFDMLNEHTMFSNNSTAFQGSSAEKCHTRKVVNFSFLILEMLAEYKALSKHWHSAAY
jgi:hypothetical protein